MGTRGRTSTAETAVVDFAEVRATMLRPSEDATQEVKTLFHQIISSAPADHFRKQDEPLVEQYAQAVALSRAAFLKLQREGVVNNGKASPWVSILEKAHKSSIALSTKLRLSPQSRIDPKTAGRNRKSSSAYGSGV